MSIDVINAWIHAHPLALAGLALASAHRRLIFRCAILALLKNAVVRRIALGNASEILADVDDFRAELKADLDEAAAANAAKKVALGPAAPGMPVTVPPPAVTPPQP